jgi:hypothetical protein
MYNNLLAGAVGGAVGYQYGANELSLSGPPRRPCYPTDMVQKYLRGSPFDWKPVKVISLESGDAKRFASWRDLFKHSSILQSTDKMRYLTDEGVFTDPEHYYGQNPFKGFDDRQIVDRLSHTRRYQIRKANDNTNVDGHLISNFNEIKAPLIGEFTHVGEGHPHTYLKNNLYHYEFPERHDRVLRQPEYAKRAKRLTRPETGYRKQPISRHRREPSYLDHYVSGK